MNKKVFLVCLVFCLLVATNVIAQEEEVSAGLTPASPFYFLDVWAENIGLFFTFNAEAKAEKALKYAQEKVAEMEKLSEEQKERYLQRVTKKYEQYLDLAQKKVGEIKQQGKDVDSLSEKMTEIFIRHQERMMNVYERVPESAKQAIEQAMEKSQHGYLRALEAIQSQEIKERVQRKIEIINERIESVLTPEQKETLEQIRERIRERLNR